MTAGLRVGVLCAALILPAPAFGQEATSAEIAGRGHTWDVGGSIEVGLDPLKTIPFPLRLELGRYWTTHLKADVSVVTGTTGPFGVSIGATYELFDRGSTRPYASIGLDVWRLSRPRDSHSSWQPRLATDRQHAAVPVRPFLAAGVKTYFGRGRGFLRSETIVAAGPHAVRNAVLRVGVGIEF